MADSVLDLLSWIALAMALLASVGFFYLSTKRNGQAKPNRLRGFLFLAVAAVSGLNLLG